MCSGTIFLYEYWKDYVKEERKAKKEKRKICRIFRKNLQELWGCLYYTALERRSQCGNYQKNTKFLKKVAKVLPCSFAGSGIKSCKMHKGAKEKLENLRKSSK